MPSAGTKCGALGDMPDPLDSVIKARLGQQARSAAPSSLDNPVAQFLAPCL